MTNTNPERCQRCGGTREERWCGYPESGQGHHPLHVMCRPCDSDFHKQGEATAEAPAPASGVPATCASFSLEVYQHDWIPGFAAFHDDDSINETAKAHVVLNLGSLLSSVESEELPVKDLPYMIAETLMHEAIHALEAWAKVEFSEERVEHLLEKYREKYRPPDEVHWQADASITRDNKNQFAPASGVISAEEFYHEGDWDIAVIGERAWWNFAEAYAAHIHAQQPSDPDEKLLADAQRRGMEKASCGHPRKYETVGIPGVVGCLICDLEKARKQPSDEAIERVLRKIAAATVGPLTSPYNFDIARRILTEELRGRK